MTPERFRLVVSFVLTIGVSLAAILIALAFAGSLAVGWGGSLIGAAAASSSVAATDFGRLGPNLAALRPVGIAQAGLIVLLFTPVMRVAASAVAFALERDRLYTVLTLLVLAVLLASILFVR